jgi:hypothetical protein
MRNSVRTLVYQTSAWVAPTGQACDPGAPAEFKTELDLTRLPSGKFDTKALVCRPAALAMNMLRPLFQRGCQWLLRRCDKRPSADASRSTRHFELRLDTTRPASLRGPGPTLLRNGDKHGRHEPSTRSVGRLV